MHLPSNCSLSAGGMLQFPRPCCGASPRQGGSGHSSGWAAGTRPATRIPRLAQEPAPFFLGSGLFLGNSLKMAIVRRTGSHRGGDFS